MDTTSTELKLWLNDRQPKSLEQMARLADEYLALRKSFSTVSEQYQTSNETVLVNANTQKYVTTSQKGVRPQDSFALIVNTRNQRRLNVSGVSNQVTKSLNVGNVKDKR